MKSMQIVIVHDDWSEKSPIVQELAEIYGKDNVKFISQSQEGINYLQNTPERKTIVILDYNFKSGEPNGGEVFRKIREKSSLIYVIIVTKSDYRDIAAGDFVEFVNNHALAIARPGDDYTEITKLVREAKFRLDNRADVILEEWILSKSPEERSKVFLATYEKKSYTLNDLLDNIRKQTDLGKEVAGNVLGLAIELVINKLDVKND